MPAHRARTREPRGERRLPATLTAPDDVAPFLQDAAHTPGGHTPAVVLPRSEAEVAEVLRRAPAVLPAGAHSSLTGGATPFGEWVLSLSRMDAISAVGGDAATVQAGTALVTLDGVLRERRLFYPPAPTFRGALFGGMAATNAAGAATFKYGATRAWVRRLTVVLASGAVLDLARGEVRAHEEGWFEIEGGDGGVARVPVPSYRMPPVAKRSAGYHAEPGLDLLDLFVGSEGTLGVVTELEVGLLPAPALLVAWAAFPTEAGALEAVRRLREAARETWRSRDPRGVDVAAIESVDRRCLELLREDGRDREAGVRFPPAADTALLVQLELPAGVDALDEAASWEEPGRDGPVVRFLRMLRDTDGLHGLELGLPGDERRQHQLFALREAVPTAVNHRIGARQREGQPGLRKTAGDMIVPFAQLPAMVASYREAFAARGLDHALWGHVSDGNVHANVIPRTEDDLRRGDAALLELGAEAVRRGGCPLSEHGVGRSRVKQELLRRLYGDDGIAQMRAVKRALDPSGKLAPGVLFPP
jgi:D-lactate dehydrogenase (cytochrome)